MQIQKSLTKKAFLAHPQVVTTVENWQAKPLDLRMLHRVALNWLNNDALSREEFRAKWIREPQADRILQSTYVAEMSGIYRPTLLGMAILVASSAKNTSALMGLCAKIYGYLRKLTHQSGRGQGTVQFSDLAQIFETSPEIAEKALSLLSDTSLGIHITRDSDHHPAQATAQEYVLQYPTLWAYMGWLIEITNDSAKQSCYRDVFNTENSGQFATILAVVQDGPTHLSRSLEWLNERPDAAITSARALMESTIKWVVDDAGHNVEKLSDLDKLFNRCVDAIGLNNDTDIGISGMVSGMNTALIGLAKLRNKRGNAHGANPRQPSATRRHARLAVLLSIALSTYFVEAREATKQG